MTQTAVDSLPVTQLPDRYSISRSVLYGRLSDLQIETERRGNKAYVDAQQIELLDRLHEHIQSGGTTAEFLVAAGLSAKQSAKQSGGHSKLSGGQSAEQILGQSDGLFDRQVGRQDSQMAIALLGDVLATRLAAPADPLANLKALEEACQHGWHLSTSQLAQLLGLKSLSGKEIYRHGFVFTRTGRNGAESAWNIKKAVPQ